MPRIASLRPLMLMTAGLPGIRRIGITERAPFGLKDEKARAYVLKAQQKANGGKPDAFPLGAIRQLYRLADHVDRVAADVRAPALILHARDDDTSSVANAYRLRSRLGGEAQVELLEDSYHLIHLDQEMPRVAALTAQFFNLPGAERIAKMAAAMPMRQAG